MQSQNFTEISLKILTTSYLVLGIFSIESCRPQETQMREIKPKTGSQSETPLKKVQKPPRADSCALKDQTVCWQLESELTHLRTTLEKEEKEKEKEEKTFAEQKAELTLERNFKSGLLDLYSFSSDSSEADLKGQEVLLQKIYAGQKKLFAKLSLERAHSDADLDLKTTEKTRVIESSEDASESATENSPEDLTHNPVNRSDLKPYTEGEHLAVMEVMRELGGLYINISPQDANGQPLASEVGAAPPQPWTGYWFPKRGTELFADTNSPLAKFDLMVNRLGGQSKTVDWEKAHHDADSAEWAGLCDAWAMAAISTQEPTRPLSLAGVNFEIGDIKALLTKVFEGFRPKMYGRRYLGTADTDGEIQDLRPEAFHRIIEMILGERRQSIVVDDEPGTEVWSKPLFRMRWFIVPDPSYANAVLVTAWPRLIKNRMRVSHTITSPFDMKIPEYQYRLFYDPNNERNGKYLVVYGEWLGATKFEHPDMVLLPLTFSSVLQPTQPQALQPKNPELAKNINYFKDLISQGQTP